MLITGKLALQLGFESDVALTCNKSTNNAINIRHAARLVHGKKIQPPNPINVHIGYDIIYIYTDCIEEQLVGDVQAQLLRSVCINNGDTHQIQTISFDSPHYIPVTKTDFDTIDINIRDGNGRKLPFLYG